MIALRKKVKKMNEGTFNEQYQKVMYEDTRLSQFDVTRDFRGTFYAKGNWKAVHKELSDELSDKLRVKLRPDGNSLETCFQFKELTNGDKLRMRIKVYNKLS
jgi:hypothetical protein